jgi:hypothetical protein
MPEIDIIDPDHALRWDALGIIEATVYFPRGPEQRAGYEARWRAAHRALLPPGKRLTQATTYDPAREFGKDLRRRYEDLRRRRLQIERVGTALWLKAVLSQIAPASATESRVSYGFGQLGMRMSRSTIKRNWRTYRGVSPWCAAMSYQRFVFGTVFPCYPLIGPPDYSIDAALWDFLRLGYEFYAFACDSGAFAATPNFNPERDLWTLPARAGQ